MKCLCGPDEMAVRAGFGPQTVVWRPLIQGNEMTGHLQKVNINIVMS